LRKTLNEQRLIIALDEFEQLEEWITNDRLPTDIMKTLRGYIQMDERIAFAFRRAAHARRDEQQLFSAVLRQCHSGQGQLPESWRGRSGAGESARPGVCAGL
jgi:hypothetical protein